MIPYSWFLILKPIMQTEFYCLFVISAGIRRKYELGFYVGDEEYLSTVETLVKNYIEIFWHDIIFMVCTHYLAFIDGIYILYNSTTFKDSLV